MDEQKTHPIVACQALTKVFKDFWMRSRVRAIDDISFEIFPGEIFGLLGPNGSGKSTTIKILLGLLRPTQGRVVVFGRPPDDVETKRKIGYLPEESYLYPFLNARETLDYYAKLFEIDARVRARRIDELLDMVGLTGVQFRPVREYSKGMQRRIGIAQALINDPDLLILDEPTTGLDPIGTRQIKDLILELGRRGKSVLLSSHLLADVEDCVDRMVILYGGKIRSEGTCEELLVSHERSVLEFDSLDEQTVAAIDELVRQRTAGEGAIRSVTRPRQRLEELFVDIVERARAERIETSGAAHGGTTASFLLGDEKEGDVGDALIDRLTSEEPEPEREAPSEAPDEPTGPDTGVLGDLLSEAAPEPEAEPERGAPDGPAPQAPADVDSGVIDSLLDDKPEGDR